MQPLEPKIITDLLGKGVTIEEIEEYSELLAARFAIDPEASKAPEQVQKLAEAEKRLEELHRRLFGSRGSNSPTNKK